MRTIVSNTYRLVRRTARSIKLHALWQKQHPCAQLLAFSAHAAITRSLTAEELGTALGISGAYQAAALRLNGLGTLTCLDGSAELCRIAKRNWQELGLDNVDTVVGPFEVTLDAQLEDKGPVDYVFIDGHHDRQATIDYFERIAPRLAREDLLVFDDIRWSEGMQLAWKAIERDPRVKVSMDFGTLGVCVMGEVQSSPPWRLNLN
ncbi:MAG: class I SAM-dependent methyltransferase [Deltaproteobacteria bacterium]|nr:class I SAM-dependent methyltransferase [Deltaproteobacteria bacterium]